MARKAQSKPEKVVEVIEESQPVTPIAEAPAVAVEVTPHSACGGVLKAAREQQKLTVQEIAAQLRLGVTQIEALEADRYDKLPQPSIVRGFIRNYAKALKIDAAPIVAAYSALVPDAAPQSFAVKPSAHPSVIGETRIGFSFKLFMGLLLCFGLVAGMFYYYTNIIKPNIAAESATSTVQPPVTESATAAASGAVEFALPAAERQENSVAIDLPPPVDTGTTANPPPVQESQTPTTATVPQPVMPSSTEAAANALQPKPANVSTPTVPPPAQQSETVKETVETAVKSGQLVIDASEETWINVVDAKGKQIYSKVLAAGSSDTISVSPPLNITVGNAHGTSISLNGETLDLLSHTKDRVARLKVN